MQAISVKALNSLRPLVVSIVDQNVKEIRRNSSNMAGTEEQKHLNYIADSMESSMGTATRALDCKDVISNIKLSSSDGHLSSQLDEILRKQSEILQISANSLMTSKRHYAQQFMPGSLSTPSHSNISTKTLSYITQKELTNGNDDDDDDNIKCKDTSTKKVEHESDLKTLDLTQIFNKLQVTVKRACNNSNDHKNKQHSVSLKHLKNDYDDDKKENDDDDSKNYNKSAFEMKKLWINGLVMATHFVTVVWMTLKDETGDHINDTNTKTPR
eukprot:487158_1